MVKKILLIVMLCWVVSVQAQQAVGQWEVYPSKSTVAGAVYESTGEEVYYISGNNLFSYNKVTSEIETYNTGNYLSDTGIKNIYYNYDKDYLMVVYENANIDLIYNDRSVVNIPDIKNTIMMNSKAINDVFFANNKAYIATDFGVVIINDDKWEVYESYMYGKVFSKITKAGDNLLAIVDGVLYRAPIKAGMYNFAASWSAVDMGELGNPTKVAYLYGIDDNHVLYACDEVSYVYDLSDDAFTLQNNNLYYARCITPTPQGYLITFSNNARFLSKEIGDDNQIVVLKTLSLSQSSVQNGYCSSYNNDESLWCCSPSGISNFTVTGSTINWLVSPSEYNTSSVAKPQSIQVHNNKVYVKNMGPYNYSVDMANATTISVYDLDEYEWSVLNLDKVTRDGNVNSKGALRSSLNLAFDPDSSEIFYVGSWFDGIHKFNGTKYVGNYNQHNTYLAHPWAMLASFTDFDSDGNLWSVFVDNQLGSSPLLACLPADKKVIDPTATTATDWKTYDVGSPISYFVNLLVCKNSPYVFVVHARLVNPTRLTVVNRNTGEMRIFSTFTDQDGNSFGNGVLYFLTASEDKNGNVWLGTSSGPIVLNNISNIMNSNYRCTRVKVPRNDGTNYADYLLEDETINDIVVDGANRKWLATSSSGVYLVSENGSEILENHTVSNSLLPSNLVYDMDINDATGELFVATELGVASYRADVSEVAPNYDNVEVFPNPVRPEYNGVITIQGLMENSLVKITDVSGNLFSQGYSNGGTYVWDGRTATGERVKTGVYLVYASQSGGKSGVVTKIMVVN